MLCLMPVLVSMKETAIRLAMLQLVVPVAYTVSPSEYQPHAGSTVPIAVSMTAVTQPVL